MRKVCFKRCSIDYSLWESIYVEPTIINFDHALQYSIKIISQLKFFYNVLEVIRGIVQVDIYGKLEAWFIFLNCARREGKYNVV